MLLVCCCSVYAKGSYKRHPDERPHLLQQLRDGIAKGIYDPSLEDIYTEDEWDQLDSYIDHDRDYLFTYAGLRQVVDKYLVQDRSTGEVYETPQFMYMLIAATLFRDYEGSRLEYVRKYYNAISKHKINIPTPVMAGVRTALRQFASCVLVDSDDTLSSIFTSDSAIGKCRSAQASVLTRGESVASTLKSVAEKSSTQASSLFSKSLGDCPMLHSEWHPRWKRDSPLPNLAPRNPRHHRPQNNKGTEDNRVRKLDYSIQLSKLFYERFISNADITLFSPHDVPGLYDAFGTDRFDDLYTQYEQDETKPKTTIGAQKLILDLLKERVETGRIYLMNIDHCNSHSSFKDKVNMSNLCQEITLPTDPLEHIDGEGEIALCILSAINVGKIRKR